MSLRWQNPPPTADGRAEKTSWLKDACDEMRKHPGQWALINTSYEPSGHGSTRHALKNGTRRHTRPAGSFESKCRKLDDGTYGLFARYIGDGSDE